MKKQSAIWFAAAALICVPAVANSPFAYNQGFNDGNYDGSWAGRERGTEDGAIQGRVEGYQEGRSQCEREEAQRQYDLGFTQGYGEGQNIGTTNGQNQGLVEGRNAGTREGRNTGVSQANHKAQEDATPAGTQKGLDDAEKSDATTRGQADGAARGDKEANEAAIAQEYQKARDNYRHERFDEPVSSRDHFSQRPREKRKTIEQAKFLLAGKVAGIVPPPDMRRYFPRPSPFYSVFERQSYFNGYRNGYNNGFIAAYSPAFSLAYQPAYQSSWTTGCNDGRQGNFSGSFERGRRSGYDQGYQSAYQAAYTPAFSQGRAETFEPTRAAAYSERYPIAYREYFEKARTDAYAKRVDELYRMAYEPARKQKRDEMYPIYAEQQRIRGRNDEADDFRRRPVRLLSAQVTETIENGIDEPGEPLRIRLKLRNFSDEKIRRNDIRIKIRSLTPNSAIVSEPETTLVNDLNPKSETEIDEALEFQMLEASVDRECQFSFTVHYQGRQVEEQILKVTPKFLVRFDLQNTPILKEGLPVPIMLNATNESLRPTPSDSRIRLSSELSRLEILEPEQLLGSIDPFNTSLFNFSAIARTGDSRITIPLVFEAFSSTRRVGLLDLTREVPVENDYRIQLTNSLANLRNAGITRAGYKIRNVNSRLVHRSLQVWARVGNNFEVIGPNPQYLAPINHGESTEFVIPIYAKADNNGGVLEFEIQEDGVTVVKHRESF